MAHGLQGALLTGGVLVSHGRPPTPLEYIPLPLVLLPITSIAYGRHGRRVQLDWICTTTCADEQGIQPYALRPWLHTFGP